jgi:probable rRNA maturation factor
MTTPPDRRAPALEIDIQTASPLWAAQPRAEETVRAALVAAASAQRVEGEVSMLLTDDAAIRTLNRSWRQIDKPTNVLSFPAAKDATKHGDGAFVGDLVVAYETLARECADEDRDFLHHLAHLTVHGFLHLIGYDHQTDAQAEEMEGLESRIMQSMNMTDPYLARDLERS